MRRSNTSSKSLAGLIVASRKMLCSSLVEQRRHLGTTLGASLEPGNDCSARLDSLCSLSQKVTYLFCDELNIVSKELRSRVRQATKDVVKSEV